MDDGIVKSSDALQNTTVEKEKMDAVRAAADKTAKEFTLKIRIESLSVFKQQMLSRELMEVPALA